MSTHLLVKYKLICVIFCLAISNMVGAQEVLSRQIDWKDDTLNKDVTALELAINTSIAHHNELERHLLSDSITTGTIALQKMDNKSIGDFFKSLNLSKHLNKHEFISDKSYYNLAILFARMKNYPLALRYFAKAGAMSENPTIADKKYHVSQEDTSFLDLPLPTMLYDSTDDKATIVSYSDTLEVRNRIRKAGIESKPISRRAIMAPFRKNKDSALTYGILIHVKQPAYGKRKQYQFINNVGHMFITLVQYLPNNNSVTRTFGFYPEKDNFLSATPIFPQSSSTFKDDVLHDWDEAVGKFITYKQFYTILKLVSQYSKKKYHLSKNNCTDFGLVVSAVAGIDITDTKGTWPLGKGNDPGDAGQSIMEGKVKNLDSSNLFICVNPDLK